MDVLYINSGAPSSRSINTRSGPEDRFAIYRSLSKVVVGWGGRPGPATSSLPRYTPAK